MLDAAAAHALELFQTSPALFVENQGQWEDESVRFLHSGNGASVAMTDSGPVFQVLRREAIAEQDGQGQTLHGLDADLLPDGLPYSLRRGSDPIEYRTEMLTFSATFVGAHEVEPVGLDRSESVFHYFVGPQEDWHGEVSSYGAVAYEDLYDGIDLHTWGLRSSLKYEFQVAPGADYTQIAVQYDGIAGLAVNEDGALVVDLGGEWGQWVDDAPYIYQTIDGQQVEVAGRFELLDDRSYAFEVTGDYEDGRQPDHRPGFGVVDLSGGNRTR